MRAFLFTLILVTSAAFAVMCTQDSEQAIDLPTIIEPEAPPSFIVDTVLSEVQELRADFIDGYFSTKHEAKEFYGNVLIAEQGKVIYKNSFGYANVKTKDTLTIDHSFQLASVSKPFTAYAALLLIQEGKIGLDDLVQKHLPTFPYQGITIRQLMSHRSGLNNYMYFADEVWPNRYIQPITNDDVLALYRQHQPMYYRPPNQTFEYNNTGFIVLASIVEKVSGMPFEDFMKVRIFNPLNMNNTTIYRKGNGEVANAATGYNSSFKVEDDTYLNGVVGDKGVYSTAEDLLRFDRALHEGELLKKSWVDSAHVPHNEWKKEVKNYGLGWRLRKMPNDQTLVFHTGWWKGFRSYFLRDIENDRTIIVLSNVKRGGFLSVEELMDLLEHPKIG